MSAKPGERRTLFEIEREKRWRVWLLFALLVAVVFVGAWVACLIVTVSLFIGLPVLNAYAWMFTLRGVGLIFVVAAGGSLLYWFAARVGARERLVRAMHCKPLDPGDRYHQRLANIVEEMRIATGGPRIECFTVATLGLNAFAFSDLKGAGVIGVTEGALARLSRQQLEAVVAHEFGHILSGSYVTVTVSCLLFGIYSSLGDKLEEATMSVGASRAAPLAIVAILLRGWLWVLQLASSVTNAALSRERERQADLAAARYTRDPLSLAEALRVISRHPGGTGYIPEGLAPLCIRATESRKPWLFGDRRSTHPPINERIDVLLALAAVAPDEFTRQTEKAAENLAAREHWAPAPASGGAGRRMGVETAGAVLAPAAASPATAVLAGPLTAMAAPLAAGGGAAAAPPRPATPLATPVARGSGAPAAAAMICPGCGASLSTADYEGLTVFVCTSCGGRLVSSGQVSKILARRDAGFSDEQQHLADLLAANGDALRRAARMARGQPGVNLIPCPRCAKKMMRRHYNYEFAVEIDYCIVCDLFWFDRDELEALQILSERQIG